MELAPRGVHVLCVCPGYVDTPFRENVLQGKIPDKVAGQRRFLISADECAKATLDGLRQGKRTVVTPRLGWALVVATRLLPGLVFGRMARMKGERESSAAAEA
jgi:short-subunit dehydrogenase